MEPWILAVWGAASVFVLWLALVSVVRKRTAKPSVAPDYPAPTPEELMEAQSLGLVPRRPNPTVPTNGER